MYHPADDRCIRLKVLHNNNKNCICSIAIWNDLDTQYFILVLLCQLANPPALSLLLLHFPFLHSICVIYNDNPGRFAA